MYRKARPKRSRLSEQTFRQLVKCFSLDLTANDTAKLLHLNRNTVNRYYRWLRSLVVADTTSWEPVSGEVEVDESYFGPRRVRGKRGRGAGKKTIVFGILERQGKVHTAIVPNCQIPTIVPIINAKVCQGTTIYSDDLGTYRFLFLKYDHKVVYHSKSQFGNQNNHVNGIESFWAYTKHRIRKFKGIRKTKFLEYLKESEWRFNHRHSNLNKELLTLINPQPSR